MARQYECLEAGCDEVIVAADTEALVAAVHKHMADKHDSFELEDVIIDASTDASIDASTEVDGAEKKES